jgi:hypothetical protein
MVVDDAAAAVGGAAKALAPITTHTISRDRDVFMSLLQCGSTAWMPSVIPNYDFSGPLATMCRWQSARMYCGMKRLPARSIRIFAHRQEQVSHRVCPAWSEMIAMPDLLILWSSSFLLASCLRPKAGCAPLRAYRAIQPASRAFQASRIDHAKAVPWRVFVTYFLHE